MYWFAPKNKNPYMLPLIFIIAYVAMAWYDHLYNCDITMYTGKYGDPSSIMKPQRRKDLVSDQESLYMKKVYLFHILGVAPLLLFAGNPKLLPVLKTTGLIALGYHGYRLYSPRKINDDDDTSVRV